MKCAIMQPYFFPYIGYFQLINAADVFVIYDDVTYRKGGWINRNFILGNDAPQRLTLQLSGASSFKLINEISLGGKLEKLIRTIDQSYRRAPCYSDVRPLIAEIFADDTDNLAEFLSRSLRKLCDYIGINTDLRLSSAIDKNSELRAADKVVAICHALGAEEYINAVGGRELYDHEFFAQQGLKLWFLESGAGEYEQFGGPFCANLSIIDVLMFNSPQRVQDMLGQYELAQ